MRRHALVVGGATLVLLVAGLLIFVTASRRYGGTAAKTVAAVPPAAPAPPGRKIKARLFYVAEDGSHLTAVERDVAYGESAVDQAREIVAAQIAPVAEPLVSAVPPGTALRALYVTEHGDAFVDLSRDVASNHPGGTTSELLTIYTIVNALTANLPAVTGVQVLVDGKEVQTLAGHVDLRRPLEKNLAWVQ
jgi:spore germination protein GerM